MNYYYPSFQLGTNAIREWKNNLDQIILHGPVTAPAHPVAPRGGAIATQLHKDAWKDQWAFTKKLTNLPTNTKLDTNAKREEVMRFLFQIYTRFVFDQSEPPIIHSASPYRTYRDLLAMNGPGALPIAPFARQLVNAPYYAGVPGGMYAPYFRDRNGPQQGGPRAGLPGEAGVWPGGPGGRGPP